MKEEKQIPFLSVLEQLFTADPLPLELLYRLSDMSEADAAGFWAGWTAVADERRRVIVRHLADISEENYVVDFLPVFAKTINDPFAPVRIASLDGLWDATNVMLIRPIIRLMQNDVDEEVRAAAAAALAHYVLLAEWNQIPVHLSPTIVEALLAEYGKPETAVAVKRSALEAMGAANHPRVASLIEEAYDSADSDMQLSAVFAMGSSADPRWLPTIIGEMQSPSENMRAEAARAAGAIGGSDVVDALANLLMDEDLVVALAAVEALGQIGGDRPTELLQGLLDDSDFEDLHETIEEVLEEMALLSGDVDFDWLDVDED
ncbi:MAG: HEAT repeat domain-containing protein [Ardenticatenaceae bacterium]|nr:HEAT repeat domain-containing protein [Ardenticatenaceae bacterium]MCB9446284.1 HEAT repeat domain-containing protein [Ardenticatenaceae bacterium]